MTCAFAHTAEAPFAELTPAAKRIASYSPRILTGSASRPRTRLRGSPAFVRVADLYCPWAREWQCTFDQFES